MKKLLLYALFISSHCISFNFVSNKVNGTLDPQFIAEIVAVFHPDIFIETGTYNGKTALNAAPFFRKVHTIELAYDFYQQSCIATAEQKNIMVHYGSSPELLAKIIPSHTNATLIFWLDAHYCGEHSAKSNEDSHDPQAITAIRKELIAIAESGVKNCIILIDDIRGFGSTINGIEFLGCWAYPSLQEVCALGHSINAHFSFALLGDMLLMYDHTKYTPSFSPTVVACTQSRLYNGSNLTEEELTTIEKIIIEQSTFAEKQFITQLYNTMTDCKDPLFHHDLWYSLICMGSHNWQAAQVALMKVPTRIEFLNKACESVHIVRSYTPSRIKDYLQEIEKHLVSPY